MSSDNDPKGAGPMQPDEQESSEESPAPPASARPISHMTGLPIILPSPPGDLDALPVVPVHGATEASEAASAAAPMDEAVSEAVAEDEQPTAKSAALRTASIETPVPEATEPVATASEPVMAATTPVAEAAEEIASSAPVDENAPQEPAVAEATPPEPAEAMAEEATAPEPEPMPAVPAAMTATGEIPAESEAAQADTPATASAAMAVPELTAAPESLLLNEPAAPEYAEALARGVTVGTPSMPPIRAPEPEAEESTAGEAPQAQVDASSLHATDEALAATPESADTGGVMPEATTAIESEAAEPAAMTYPTPLIAEEAMPVFGGPAPSNGTSPVADEAAYAEAAHPTLPPLEDAAEPVSAAGSAEPAEVPPAEAAPQAAAEAELAPAESPAAATAPIEAITTAPQPEETAPLPQVSAPPPIRGDDAPTVYDAPQEPPPLPVYAPSPAAPPAYGAAPTGTRPASPPQTAPTYPPQPRPSTAQPSAAPSRGTSGWITVGVVLIVTAVVVIAIVAIILFAISRFSGSALPPGVLYQDKFASPAQGWVNEGDCVFQADGYHVRGPSACFYSDKDFGDGTLSVSLHRVTGSADSQSGLAFRRSTPGKFYTFEIDGAGHWYIYKSDQLAQSGANAAIKAGNNVTNVLQVVMHGSNFEMDVNGTKIITWTDADYAFGKIGVTGDQDLDVTYTTISVKK